MAIESSFGFGLDNPEGFLRFVLWMFLSEYEVVGCQISDLLQEGRIGLWKGERDWLRKGAQIGEEGYVTYLNRSAWNRMFAYLMKVRKQLRVPPDCSRPKRSSIVGIPADDGGMEVLEQSLFVQDQLVLVEGIILDLWPEHGEKDFAVFEAWVEGATRTLADVVRKCPWLKDERSAQDVLERVILALREYFGGDINAPIRLAIDGRSGASPGSRKSREEVRQYQAEYYKKRQEELKDRSRDRMRQKRAEAKEKGQ